MRRGRTGQHLGSRASREQRKEGGAMGGAGLTVTATTVLRGRILGETHTHTDRKRDRQTDRHQYRGNGEREKDGCDGGERKEHHLRGREGEGGREKERENTREEDVSRTSERDRLNRTK